MPGITTFIRRDRDNSLTLCLGITDNNGQVIVEFTEQEWKDFINHSWDMMNEGQDKIKELMDSGHLDDPFLVVISTLDKKALS